MPHSVSQICIEPGCGAKCSGRYCARHGGALLRARGSAPSARQRGYDSRHEKWRLLILHRDPLCQISAFILARFPDCAAAKRCGGMSPSVIADHIIPLRAGGDFSMSNGQGGCRACHNFKTRELDVPLIAKYRSK